MSRDCFASTVIAIVAFLTLFSSLRLPLLYTVYFCSGCLSFSMFGLDTGLKLLIKAGINDLKSFCDNLVVLVHYLFHFVILFF